MARGTAFGRPDRAPADGAQPGAHAAIAAKRGQLALNDEEDIVGSIGEIALGYAGLGDKDTAFAFLDKAFDERSTLLTYLKMDPRFDSLRGEPRFKAMLRRLNFIDEPVT